MIGGASARSGFIAKISADGAAVLFDVTLASPVTAVTVDPSGDIVAAGPNFAAKFRGSTGQQLWLTPIAAMPAALALDRSGNLYIAGTATPGFSTTAGAFQTAPSGPSDAFVLKLSPDGGTVLYATFLGGSQADEANAIAVDSAGQAYIAGNTKSKDFPVTPGAAQNKSGGNTAFVAKLDPAGARLIYATYLGGSTYEDAFGIAVDANGNAFVCGVTGSPDFPATPGAFQTKFTAVDYEAFAARYSTGGALVWATLIGGSVRESASAIAADSAGQVYVAGDSDSPDFPFTAGAVKGCRAAGPWVAELDSAGSRLLASSSIGGIGLDSIAALALDSKGAVYLSGTATSHAFFTTPGAAQPAFSGYSSAFASKLDLAAPPGLYLACILHAASFNAGNVAAFPTGEVAPGEIVSIFGTVLDGGQVSFDGVAAPIFYSGPTQINAVVPYGIKNSQTQAAVQRSGVTYGSIALPVAPAVPGIFTATGSGQGQGAVLNQDGTLNSVSNPAPRGSIISFYAAGAGLMNPPETDGAVQPLMLPLPVPQLPVSVQIRGADAKVTYAGAAPGLISGALQVNAEVPATIDFGNSVPLMLFVGGQSSQLNVTIAVK